MSDKRSEKILKSIRLAYLQQFEQTLDDQLLIEVVDRELQKKREAFLQVQLATSGLGFGEMSALKTFLAGKGKAAAKNPKDPSHTKADIAIADDSDLDLEADDFDDESDSDLEFDDSKKEKRRAYARAYYHKKKAQRDADQTKPSKKFKTTPEQRAYQRAYYQRKKAEKVALENGTLAKVAAKALQAQKQAIAKSSNSSKGKKDKLDYDAMAADRLAIENAFRPGGADDEAAATHSKQRNGQNGKEADSFIASLSLGTKTKLRKAAKGGSLST